ncbi:invasion associated locus B family protein [Mesorhizobium sp. BR1-1-9]|uniref:invasion associated locus B family protein n=1 Tax=unclassified Mesorhizobium TaxID=325217 RepID=UPI001CD18469|nr:invasion associated locus B family protein [Mesorhizobium sp. BR1-1-9]MBZ9944090.1 invasion associated locus B family protein [Mesorhizobium sp. BR1-1-13]
MACRIADKAKRCSMSQQRVGKNRQRVLALELQAGRDSTVTGVLVLPFGLLLEKGVTLQIDDRPTLAPCRATGSSTSGQKTRTSPRCCRLPISAWDIMNTKRLRSLKLYVR